MFKTTKEQQEMLDRIDLAKNRTFKLNDGTMDDLKFVQKTMSESYGIKVSQAEVLVRLLSDAVLDIKNNRRRF